MKKAVVLLFVFLPVLTLFGCGMDMGTGELPSDIISEITGLYGKLPKAHKLYISGAEAFSDSELSSERFSEIYFLNGEDGEKYYDMLDEYAVYMGSGMELFEIHIIKVSHLSDAENIERIYGYRKNILMKSVIFGQCDENYKNTVNNISIFSKGKYVYMLVTYDNSVAESYIK